MANFFGWELPLFVPKKQARSAKYQNDIQTIDIFNRLTNIALSRFKWYNLPETCYADVLEETLFFYGTAVFFKDPDYGFIHTPVNLPGPFNIYYESTVREAYSFGNFHRKLSIDDSVLIRNNHTQTPDYLTVWNYAPRIANCLRAIDVHTETLKRPFMVRCQEKEVQSAKTAIHKIMENEPLVLGDKFGNADSFNVLSLGKECYLGEFWNNVRQYCDQCFNSLGIRNTYTTKREQMISAEAEGDANSVRHTLESALDERQHACELINRMFHLNVYVEANELGEFRDETIELMAARVTGTTDKQKEGEENAMGVDAR